MPSRFLPHADIFKVIMIHLGAVGFTFLNVEDALKIISLSVATAYTIWKWYTEWKARQ